MKTLKLVFCALICLDLSGCSSYSSMMEGPQLSPVGSGLSDTSRYQADDPYLTTASTKTDWIGGPGDYFRDSRARSLGDLITVRISMNDNANFNSSSGRSRKASSKGSAAFNLSMLGFLNEGTASGNAGMDSASSGQGTVTRSEKLNVSLTVVVRKVYPNGTLAIEGSQEVLVNLEKRIIHISGIIDPRFISTDNSIDYSKIAEARISYGGTGKISEASKPRWGVQLWDKLSPF